MSRRCAAGRLRPTVTVMSVAIGKPDTMKKAYRHTGDWTVAFLATLRNYPSVRDACRAAGVARSTAYERRALHPDFAAAWDEALTEGVEALEAVAIERAVASSDRLMIVMLKRLQPETYGDARTPARQ